MATKLSRIVDETVRTAWVKGWTENFIKGLQNLNSKEQIETYCVEQKACFEAEVKRLSEEKAKKQNKLPSSVSWLNAASTHMSQMRNAIKAWQQSINLTEFNSYPQKTKDGIINQHFALLFMNYSKDEHEKRMQPTKENKDEQRRNLEPINCLDKYQEVIESLLESQDYRELTVGLIAATGRRPSEILSTAKFIQLGQFEVSFSGQLKAKGETDKYPAFTLVESSDVIDGLHRLRRMPEIKEMKQWELFEIDSGKNSTVNTKVKEFFAGLIKPPLGEKELSNKNLRAAYAAIAIYLFCPGNHSESLFIKERLGHTGDATASNYEDYQVVDTQNRQLARGAWVERLAEEPSQPKQIESKVRLKITVGAKEVINDQKFLRYPDQLSRVEELIRLARIGKEYEEGRLIKEVVKIMEVQKPVEVIEEVVNEVEQLAEVKPVEEVKSTTTRFEEMSNEELRGCQAPGSALEKIRRSVRAIKTYNEVQAEKKAQWAINVSTLEDLSGCHSKAVRDFLDSDEGRLQVTDYNLEKGFGFQQNRGKGKVTSFIRW